VRSTAGCIGSPLFAVDSIHPIYLVVVVSLYLVFLISLHPVLVVLLHLVLVVLPYRHVGVQRVQLS
jgi:hypothetical protein